MQARAASVELDWAAALECPTAADVIGESERILGAASGPRKNVRARADVTHDEHGSWKVTLVTQTDGTSGHRTFAAETCQALADATALILAMTVNPNLTTGEPEPQPAPPSLPATEAVPEPVPVLRPASASTELLHFSVGASVAGDIGTLPSVAIAPQLALAWLPGGARVELAFAYFVPQRALSRFAGEGADLSSWTASAQLGYAWPTGPVAVGPLAGLGLERLGAAGFGGATSFDQSSVIMAMRGGVQLSWALSSTFSLRLVALAALPLSRPSFVVVNPAPTADELVHRPAAVSGQANFGVEWRFF